MRVIMKGNKEFTEEEINKIYEISEFYDLGLMAIYWFCLKRNEEFCLDNQYFQKIYLSQICKICPSIVLSKMTKEQIQRNNIDSGLFIYLPNNKNIIFDAEIYDSNKINSEDIDIDEINSAYYTFISKWRIAPREIDSGPPKKILPMPFPEKISLNPYINGRINPIVITLDPMNSFQYNLEKAEKAIKEGQINYFVKSKRENSKEKTGKNYTSMEDVRNQLRIFEIRETLSSDLFQIIPEGSPKIKKQTLKGKHRFKWHISGGICKYRSELKKIKSKSTSSHIDKDLKKAELYIENPRLILRYLYEGFSRRRTNAGKK